MPIKPENKHLYSKDWPRISERIKAEAGYRCVFCGIPQYCVYRLNTEENEIERCGGGNLYFDEIAYGGCDTYLEAREITDHLNNWVPDGNGLWKVVVLTVAHLDHNPENNEDVNLACLCQRCHNRHDAGHRKQNRGKTLHERKFKHQLKLF